jgi:hypothetical protein
MTTQTLRAGTGAADITPANGEDLCGFARRTGPTAGVYDRLHSRALFLTNGSQQLLISANDIIGIGRQFYADRCRELRAAPALRNAAIHIATSHTHSGPAVMTLKQCGRRDARYVQSLSNKIRQASLDAARRTAPVRMEVSQAKVKLSRNRCVPRGPTDNEVYLLKFLADDRPIAWICNYACHPVVLGHENNSVSADYPGALQSAIEAHAPGSRCLFLNGACGDVNPILPEGPDPEPARQMGEQLAAAALAAPVGYTIQSPALRSCSVPLTIPLHVPRSAGELRARHEQLAEAFAMSPDVFAPRLRSMMARLAAGTFPRAMHATMSLVTVGGEVAIFFIPGELFAEIGLAIKRMSPFRTTLISAFSDGTVGYLPTRQAYAQPGYETHYACFFYNYPEFSPGVEDVVLAGAKRLLQKAEAVQ